MNLFMMPLYQEFEEHLYRLFILPLDEIGGFAWTLDLNIVVLEEGQFKVAENA